MGRSRNNNRRGGRKRGGKLRHAIDKAELFTHFRPPLRQPAANRSWVFPMTVAIGHSFVGAGPVRRIRGVIPDAATNVKISTEDVIKATLDVVDAGADWTKKVTLRLQEVMCYGLVTGYDKTWVPGVAFYSFDPLTGVTVKTTSVIGDVDDPARVGWKMPAAIQAHSFSWDGTPGTSAPIAVVRTADTLTAWVYVRVVVQVNGGGASQTLNNFVSPCLLTNQSDVISTDQDTVTDTVSDFEIDELPGPSKRRGRSRRNRVRAAPRVFEETLPPADLPVADAVANLDISDDSDVVFEPITATNVVDGENIVWVKPNGATRSDKWSECEAPEAITWPTVASPDDLPP